MRVMKVLLPIFLCAIVVRTATAQSGAKQNAEATNPVGRDGVITGRVINDSGRPAAGAGILVIKSGVKITSGLQMAAADDEGNFKVTGLGPGSYRLFTNIPGYVTATTGSDSDYHRPGENITINLIKGGVITGRVTDAYGEPMVGVRVQAHKARDLEGGRKYSPELLREAGKLTDDRGVYRLYGLEPGVYVVGVSNDSSGLYGGAIPGREATTWHPSSPRATATEITVRGGDEIAGVDIRHRGERGHTISGTVSGAAASGQGPDAVSVMLMSGADRQLAGMTATIGARGFAMFGVPDGEYEIAAVQMSSTQSEFPSAAPRRVVVRGADVSRLELRIAPPASISGQVKIESSGAGKSFCEDGSQAKDRAMIEGIVLGAASEEQSQRPIQSLLPQFSYMSGAMGGAPNEKGEFALNGLAAGRFRMKADLPDDRWYIRAITQSAAASPKKPVDASRGGITVKAGEKLSGVEIIIAEGAASLNGRIVPAKEESKSLPRLRAHLIPAEVSAADEVLRYAETEVGGDGTFEFKHIAPGKYLLHTRQIAEKEANDDRVRPSAWDGIERAKLRREAVAARNEIELNSCQRVKDHVLRW